MKTEHAPPAVPRRLNLKVKPEPAPAPPKPTKQKRASKKDKENKVPTVAEFERFHEMLQDRYDIDGCNTVEIVYARRENDEQRAQLEEQSTTIEQMKLEMEELKMRARNGGANAAGGAQGSYMAPVHPDQEAGNRSATDTAHNGQNVLAGARGPRSGSTGAKAAAPADNAAADEDGAQHDQPLINGGADEMDVNNNGNLETERLKRENAELKRQLAAANAGGAVNTTDDNAIAPGSIPAPAGIAGTHYNIQDEMGLADDKPLYKGLQRYLRDLSARAGINWELEWDDISAESKGKLYRIARKAHPILGRFYNDWATKDIVKQYIGNKRKNAYKNGWLEVPAKYAHLKANAAKRNQSAPRGRQSKKARVHVAQKRQALKKTASRASSSKQVSTSKAKGKQRAADRKRKAIVDSDSDEEDDEEEEDDVDEDEDEEMED